MGNRSEECHIGIDLGTTYSCVSLFKPPPSANEYGSVEVLVNDQNKTTTPSVVSFEGSQVLVGDEATRRDGTNTIYAVKRILGRAYNDPAVAEHKEQYQYQVVNENGMAACSVDFRGERAVFTPEYISSLIIGSLKQVAEKSSGRKITSAVITVPAYFSNAQRASTRKAGENAGLAVSQIINEPTAAAIAYGVQQRSSGEKGMKRILVYDLGGGTFDVTILSMDGKNFYPSSHGGDTRLGGEDFDWRFQKLVLEKFVAENGGHPPYSAKSLLRLRKECEIGKKLLSGRTTMDVVIEVPNFHGGLDIFCEVSQAEFENCCEDLVMKTISIVEKTISDAGIVKKDIDEVLLVGGSSQIPMVRTKVREYFYGQSVRSNISSAEAVSLGAAIQAQLEAGCFNSSGTNC